MKRKLTDTLVKAAKLPDGKKTERHADGGGMYLLLKASGKYFMFDYTRPVTKKRNTMSLGHYPDTSLKQAREHHVSARELLARNIDPCEYRQRQKDIKRAELLNTFESVARQWYEQNKDKWADSTAKRVLGNFEKHVFPWIGGTPVNELAPAGVLSVVRRIADGGAVETSHRTLQKIGEVLRYAVVLELAERDVTADLRGTDALPQVSNENHHAAITDPREVGKLMRAISSYSGDFRVRMALMLTAYLFPRQNELGLMEWAELDLQNQIWEVPAHKMKRTKKGKANGIPHIVPLPRQVIDILAELQSLTGRYKHVLTSCTDTTKGISNNTVRQALRRIGYTNKEMTAHGFRTTASTLLYELGYRDELVERQLAHTIGNKVRRAYDRSELIDERAAMMQRYADYLDELRDS